MIHRCGTCSLHWPGRAPGRIACGAGVNDGRLRGDNEGPENPIWAERKYSLTGILAMAANNGNMLEGQNCEDLAENDGGECKLWVAS